MMGNTESFEEMIRIFCKISPEISLEEGIFDWSQKDILQQELETRPDLKNRLKLFANFVFDHKNSREVYDILCAMPGFQVTAQQLEENGTIVSNMIFFALPEYVSWLQNNLYHFALLYKFADTELISKEYGNLLLRFLYHFPDGTWHYPTEGTDPSILTDQINFLLDTARSRSSELSEEQMKNIGFHDATLSLYLLRKQLTLKEVSQLKSRFGGRNLTKEDYQEIERMYHENIPSTINLEKLKGLGFRGNIAKYVEIYLKYASLPLMKDLMELSQEYSGNFNITDYNRKLDKLKKSLCFKLLKRVLAIPEKTNEVKMQLEKLPKIEDKIDALVKIIDESHS